MAHHPKWKIVDRRKPTRMVVGRLKKLYLYKLDGDLNFQIKPNKEYADLIERKGLKNKDGRIECEVETLDRYEQRVLEAFENCMGAEFTAHGVWVNDTPHGSKFELHPLDALFTKLRGKDIPLWTKEFNKKYRGTKLEVHRVFAAADQSDRRHPPLADKTRTTKLEIAFPAKPKDTKTKRWKPEIKSDISINKHSKHTFKIKGTKAKPVLEISITPRAFTEGEPGLMLFDIVTFWKPEKIETTV